MTDTLGFGEEIPENDALWDRAEFDKGREKRVSILLLLDTSRSMAPDDVAPPLPIDELNGALVAWADEIRADAALRARAEVAVVTFGRDGVSIRSGEADQPFMPVALFEPETLSAGGVTPMLPAIDVAIDLTQRRKEQLDAQRIRRFRPFIFMLTDGRPTDPRGRPESDDEVIRAAREIAALEAQKKLAFFAVGVRDADVGVLRQLVPTGYWDLRNGKVTEFLRLVSTSAGKADPITFAREQFAKLSQATA